MVLPGGRASAIDLEKMVQSLSSLWSHASDSCWWGRVLFAGTKKQASGAAKANNDDAVGSVAPIVGLMSKAVLAGKGEEQAGKKEAATEGAKAEEVKAEELNTGESVDGEK